MKSETSRRIIPPAYRRKADELLDDLEATFADTRRQDFWPEALSDALGGGIADEYVVLTGEPGSGKTDLAINMCLGLANTRKVVVSSHEISKAACARRMLPCLSRRTREADPFSAEDITTGDVFGPQHADALTRTIALAKKLLSNITIVDSSDMPGEHGHAVERLADAITALGEADGETPIVIVDYVQLLDTTTSSFSSTESLDRISRALCDLSHARGTAVIAIASTGKNGTIRGSSQFDFDADIRLDLKTEEDHGDGTRDVTVRVGKFRDGPGNKNVALLYLPAFHCFTGYTDELREI